MNMKKLIIMSHGLSANGIDSFVVNVVKMLAKEKYDVSVVLALDDGVQQLREQEVLEAGVSIHRTCDLGSIKRIFLHCKKLHSILRAEKPDIFHSNMDLLNGINLLVAWFAGVPVRVCHSHTSSSQYEIRNGRHILVNAYRWTMRLLCDLFSNRKCGCSENAMEYLYGRRWREKKNSYLVSNGIDISRFSDHCNAESIRLAEGRRVIATVGRLSEVKNPQFAIFVMDELLKIRQDFKYIWVGAGELHERIQHLITEKGLQNHVELLGARNDIDAILPNCDVFLLPSLFEGLPVSLIEAQAAGIPCVISDTITREVDCGGCQFISLEKKPSHWASILSNILDQRTICDIDKSKLARFDTSHTIQQLESIYER